MSRKKWIVKNYDKEKATLLAEKLNISPYAALLASSRGINTEDEARDFFDANSSLLLDPLDFPDMYKAVKRIRRALDNFERIAVYGDYDADGVTATALLYSYLEMQGADVVYSVPDRHTEGYGLSFSAVEKLSRMGAKLIITVDNGITAVDEAEYIKQLDMDLVITDHHLPSDTLPEAVAVVDPHRQDSVLPFKDYAGVGVAYKLICALEGGENEVTESFLDLVAIGTVADVMPLLSENRRLVRLGTELLNDCDRVGLQELINVAGYEDKTVKSGTIAFGLAPRINAAGRIGSAERAIRLILCDDYDEAKELATEISDDNTARQQIEQDILSEAVEQINDNPSWKYDNVLVVSGEGWHDGVIGIVAARLTDMYGKPSIVITSDGEESKGSCRSFEGFSLYDALNSCSDYLTHFGGHTLAAGLGIKTDGIDLFRKAVNRYADSRDVPPDVQHIDFKLNPAAIGVELLSVIESLEPFGAQNPQPVFGLYNMTVTEITPIGSGKHLRLTLRRDDTTVSAVKFRVTQLEFPYDVGDSVDVAVSLEPNEYLGQMRVSIVVRNIKLHSIDDDKLFASMSRFNSLMKDKADDYSDILPDRNFIAAVYKFIRLRQTWRHGNEMLCARLGLSADNYAKVSVSVEALLSLGTVILDENGFITLPEENIRVNLDDAPILIKIKSSQGQLNKADW